MTISNLRRELEALEREGFGDRPIYTYDADGEWVELSSEQIVGDCDDETDPFHVIGFYVCSPEDDEDDG